MTLKEQFSDIQENVILAEYTTFKIGGPARYFYFAKDKDKLVKLLNLADDLKIPHFILGWGSNLLVSDEGYDGLVIKIEVKNLEVKIYQKNKPNIIRAGAGVMLGNLVGLAAENKLTGLENFVGIPGTVGGAIRGNASAWQKSIADVLNKITVLRKENGRWQIKILNKDECGFGYRESIFKYNQDIIWEGEIELKAGNTEEIKNKIQEYLNKRNMAQPSGYPNAGCVFINPSIENINLEKIKTLGLDINRFMPAGKLPAAWLIEQAGLKGKQINGAQISEKHANFIVNVGQAKAADVVDLINLIKNTVKDKFGIELKEEIEYLGLPSQNF